MYQHMLTVHTNDAHQQCEKRCQYDSTVLEGIAHGKNAGTHVALKDMHQCLEEAIYL